jgi:hypothetical protein
VKPLVIAKLALTGIGLKETLKRHKRAAWLIVALVILNEIRGMAVVFAVVKAWFA